VNRVSRLIHKSGLDLVPLLLQTPDFVSWKKVRGFRDVRIVQGLYRFRPGGLLIPLRHHDLLLTPLAQAIPTEPSAVAVEVFLRPHRREPSSPRFRRVSSLDFPF
jgi:hypothetical protein